MSTISELYTSNSNHILQFSSQEDKQKQSKKIRVENQAIANNLVDVGIVCNKPYYIPLNTLVNCVNSNHMTPLMCAARKGHIELLKVIIEAGANVNAINTEDHVTAIYYAQEHEHPECVQLLVKHGALTNIVSKAGYTAKSKAKALNSICSRFMPNDPVSSENHHVRIVANFLGLNLKIERGGFRFKAFGGFDPIFCKIFAKALQSSLTDVNPQINSLFNEKHIHQLIKVFKNLASRDKETDYQKLLKNNEIIWIPAGWAEHRIYLIFLNNYFGISNLGALDPKNKINFIRRIARFKLFKLNIRSIIDHSDSLPYSKNLNYYYETVPRLLNSKKDSLTKFIETNLNMKLQDDDNCVVKSLEKALLDSDIIMSTIIKDEYNADDIERLVNIKQNHRNFMTYTKLEVVKKYLDCVPQRYRDYPFLKLALRKLTNRINKNPDSAFHQCAGIQNRLEFLKKTILSEDETS
ncbi:MAG: ankyrin repeat domain-containing protein [Parachlamydiales bacterium]|nr:ankyrin repeat domain-containing protein [Parachlamydiales bacterium]